GAVPPKQTTGTLSGPLCQNDGCACAKTEADAGVPDDGGRKRFELRLKSAQELWVKLPGDMSLYKNKEKVEACFYVDLAPGEHPISLRASDPVGVSAELVVREIGAKTGSFYNTFQFECGNPGACSFEELDAVKESYKQYARGLHDTCGSTRIKGIAWDHGKAPDGTHPSELVVRATLDVYKFPPWKKSGDETCGEGGGRGPGGESEGEPDPAAPPAP
nr:hypothetical protein [Deltaproteobacteria bacterium]